MVKTIKFLSHTAADHEDKTIKLNNNNNISNNNISYFKKKKKKKN